MDFDLPDVLKNAPGMRAAELWVDGLSVFCFNKINPREKFWEVGFPRQAQHNLTITTQELDRDGHPVGRPHPHDVHRDVQRFFIRLTNGSLEHYEQSHFPEGGPTSSGEFDRTSANNDPNDLRWMIDLAGDELDHDFDRLKPRDAGRPRSIASIRHSLFCNLEPEVHSVRVSPVRRNDPGSRRFDIGPTNTLIVGVLLATAPGDIEFVFDPPLTPIDSLKYDANKRHRIEIRNEDTRDEPVKIKGFVRGDLRLFYDELIDVDGELKDLWAIPHPRVSPDGDCHPTKFGGATLGP